MDEDQYIIVELKLVYPLCMENSWRFSTAKSVGSFMWGKYCGHYLIYKNSHLADRCHIYGDITSLTKYLDELEVE
jgi:hypothetical protein